MLRKTTGLPVRIATPAGPRPRSVSAQVILSGFEVALVKSGLGDGVNRLGFVLPGEADPNHPVATTLDDQATNRLEQFGFIGGPHQNLAAFADHSQRAIDALQLGLGLLALRDVAADAHHADDQALGIPHGRFEGFEPAEIALRVIAPLHHTTGLPRLHDHLVDRHDLPGFRFGHRSASFRPARVSGVHFACG